MFFLQRILIPKRQVYSFRSNTVLSTSNAMSKRNRSTSRRFAAKRQKKKSGTISEGTHEEVLIRDVKRLLSSHMSEATASDLSTSGSDNKETQEVPEKFSEIEVQITELSSTGDGLGLLPSSDHVYVVPFTSPGDQVRAKVVHRDDQQSYTLTDFIEVIKPSPKRDDSRIKCPYFTKCSGCQLQMLSYEDQLAHKKTIIERAYANFSGLAPNLIPLVGNTIGSPLQYGYRTKLTPHFDGPQGGRKARRQGEDPKWTKVPPIGFMQKGTRWTIDIEDCPIGTDAVRLGMKSERARVTRDIDQYKRGATLLLRESTERKASEPLRDTDNELENITSEHVDELPALESTITPVKQETLPSTSLLQPSVSSSSLGPKHVDVKTCVTDSNAITTEYVDDFVFTNKAGAFFQNNNSILPSFTQYIRDHVIPPFGGDPPVTDLIDAYCGSGLFTITLSSLFSSSIGIDISEHSIESAHKNAVLNSIQNTKFLPATASAIFASVESHPDQTVVVIDPPRKGCDQDFLKQVLQYGPKRVVYVSCNVHTQARDVGVLVEGMTNTTRYDLESLCGFDFFPQTGHVEGVAILGRSDTARPEV